MLVQLRRFGYNKTSDWQARRRSYACVLGITVGYHVQTCLFQSLYECYWDRVVDRCTGYSTLGITRRDKRFPPFVALQCGYGVAFPGVRSLGHVRFELVSCQGVRLDVFTHFPTHDFCPHISDISSECIFWMRSKLVFEHIGIRAPSRHSRPKWHDQSTDTIPLRLTKCVFNIAEITPLWKAHYKTKVHFFITLYTYLPAALKK